MIELYCVVGPRSCFNGRRRQMSVRDSINFSLNLLSINLIRLWCSSNSAHSQSSDSIYSHINSFSSTIQFDAFDIALKIHGKVSWQLANVEKSNSIQLDFCVPHWVQLFNQKFTLRLSRERERFDVSSGKLKSAAQDHFKYLHFRESSTLECWINQLQLSGTRHIFRYLCHYHILWTLTRSLQWSSPPHSPSMTNRRCADYGHSGIFDLKLIDSMG